MARPEEEESSRPSEGLLVGRVAAKVGLSIDTMRYYERAGLVPLIPRAPNGHRRYAEDDLGWIMMLKRLRTTEMPISEMRRYADLVGQGKSTATRRREMLEDHRNRLAQRLREIEEMMPVLDARAQGRPGGWRYAARGPGRGGYGGVVGHRAGHRPGASRSLRKR